MKLKDCHNFNDFRTLAKKKLPSPIFHYIDGAADDEVTYARNTSAFNDVDLVPNVLRGVDKIDLSNRIHMGYLFELAYEALTEVRLSAIGEVDAVTSASETCSV